MKKTFSMIVTIVLLATMVIPFAVSAEYTSAGNILVPYAAEGVITIDGTMAQGEWSETNKIELRDGVNFSGEGWTGTPYTDAIDFYYSWGDAGLYMAAVVTDSQITLCSNGNVGGASRFQIALNPAGIIALEEDNQGLFFSLAPSADEEGNFNGVLYGMRHNYITHNDACEMLADEGYVGACTLSETGWIMECIIPWNYIASEERTDCINWYEYEDELLLTNFNPKDENQNRAFATATICYVGFRDGATAASRTCKDGDASVWSVDGYDVVLFFMQEGDTTRDTATEYHTMEVEPDATTEAPADTDEGDATTAAPAGDATTAAPAGDETDKADDDAQGGVGAWLWIVIAVVAVAVVAVVVVVVAKKKK